MRFVFLYIILIQNVYGSLTLKYQLKSWANNALLTSAVSGITLLEECVVKKLYNYLPTRLESVLEKSSFDIAKILMPPAINAILFKSFLQENPFKVAMIQCLNQPTISALSDRIINQTNNQEAEIIYANRIIDNWFFVSIIESTCNFSDLLYQKLFSFLGNSMINHFCQYGMIGIATSLPLLTIQNYSPEHWTKTMKYSSICGYLSLVILQNKLLNTHINSEHKIGLLIAALVAAGDYKMKTFETIRIKLQNKFNTIIDNNSCFSTLIVQIIFVLFVNYSIDKILLNIRKKIAPELLWLQQTKNDFHINKINNSPKR